MRKHLMLRGKYGFMIVDDDGDDARAVISGGRAVVEALASLSFGQDCDDARGCVPRSFDADSLFAKRRRR
jgi:hypothetical protein